ncbi:GNAT superfamily N-acetyltransferase [Methylohalomonas lacus]|uniref:GNAT superfamily N-acetyltransferase n=1 Tax=Methylohalomonas lacus TaxID=398773 RepID=A0AAE3L1W4_9GAMM|nr:GNAT family N-acetyltransferase [Methylohalomonas lacus]MCS3904165.1 GNAT superfamily N-acetyltransferase [Methylohalomonas lacus]
MSTYSYSSDQPLTAEQFIELLQRSGLAERRPVDDRGCVAAMLEHANLLVTAWDGDRLIGVARSVTDFSYCCYLSDLAVDRDYQGRGVGRALIDHSRRQLGPKARIILLSAPAAADYYPHIGFSKHDGAWILKND